MSGNNDYLNDLEQCKHLAELEELRIRLEEQKIKSEQILKEPTSLNMRDYFYMGVCFVLIYIFNSILFSMFLFIVVRNCVGDGLIGKTIAILVEFYMLYISIKEARSLYAYFKISEKETGIDSPNLSPDVIWDIISSAFCNENKWNLTNYFNSIKEQQNKAVEDMKELEKMKLDIAREIAEEYIKLDMKSEKGELHLPKEYWTLASKLKKLYELNGADTLQKGLIFLKMNNYR